jgi:hypothetical protein
MNRASATSRFFFPSPTSWAIRCSVGVSSLDGGIAPPTRARSFRAPCAHSGAPRARKRPSACSRVERAARFCLALRSTSPFTSRVRASSKGCGTRRWSTRACSSAERAADRSPRAAVSSPRPRPAVAMAHGRSRVRHWRSRRSRSASASSSLPRETSASIASGTTGTMPGSGDPISSRNASTGSSRSIAAMGLDRESSRNPSTARWQVASRMSSFSRHRGALPPRPTEPHPRRR